METHVLSPEDLRRCNDDPYCYTPHIVTTAIMESESTLDVVVYNANSDIQETIVQLIMFG